MFNGNDPREKTKIAELYHFDVLRDLYIVKLNPMDAWSRDEVQDYIKKHELPVNALSARGYRSIGCQPRKSETGSNPTAVGRASRRKSNARLEGISEAVS